jgi:hypothetical protein
MLKEADVLDFPGVALKDSQGNSLTRLDLSQVGERDHRLLTTVFKRGKTSSIVMGYGDDVSIDAFALLIRAKSYPSKPEQLCSGIRYWWERVSPGFQSATNESTPTPLPLSVCMTFFGHVLVELAQTKPKAGVGPLFKDMLEPLTPFDRPANASYFTTTYTSFKAAGEIRLDDAERKFAVDIIKQDADFQRVFRSAESKASFDHLVTDPDGGVSFFFERQLAKLQASERLRHLAALAERDTRTGMDLLRIAIPEVEDAGAQQKRTLAEVARAVEANLRLWETSLPRELKQFDQIEDATSLYSYWIRSLLAVEPEELEPLPLDFAQQNRESKFGYVSRQWARWRDGSVARMKKVKGFNWGLFGLRDESEARGLLKLMSEGRQLDRELVEWLTEQMGFLQVESDARVLRQELAVVLGNIVRTGCIRPGPRAAVGSLATVMRRHVSWENDLGGNADSPHYHKVIKPFLEGLQSLRPSAPQRPTLPGDAELRNLWIS